MQDRVQLDDALIELRPARQSVGGGVEGAEAELGVSGDGHNLVHASADEPGRDRKGLRWGAGWEGERQAQGTGGGESENPVIVGRRTRGNRKLGKRA